MGITILTTSIVLAILSGVAKAFMDLSSEDRLWSKWWNKNQSWENKYKYKPKWLFTTVLVFVTDGWHLMQFFYMNFFILACILSGYGAILPIWADFIMMSVLTKGTFEVLYSYLKKKLK